jgi:hypothetical protein
MIMNIGKSYLRRAEVHKRGNTTGAVAAHDESGAVLILALVFLVAVSMLVLALSGWVGNDLMDTTSFVNARSLDFATSSATELAIQEIRYTPLLGAGQTLNASPPAPCWGNGPTSEPPPLNGMSVAVWCSSAWNPSSANTRVVTFSACLSDLSAAACAAQPFLQTVVTFDDYPPGLSSPNPGGACNLFCGTSMTEDSSEWSPVIPAITSVSPGTGPITSTLSIPPPTPL